MFKDLNINLAEKYLLNRTVTMHLLNKLHKWDYSTWNVWPQLEFDFCKFPNRWNP